MNISALLRRAYLLLPALTALNVHPALADPDASALGAWNGVTASAPLDGPYENPKAFDVNFGAISYYNNPWRGYMDTWSASQYNNSVGVVWGAPIKYTEPVCQLMQEAGVRNIRVEIGWSSIDFDDQLTARAKSQLETQMQAFKRHGIRPLILLNANDGVPGPVRSISVTVAAPALKGSSTVLLSDYSAVRPGYSGFGIGRAGYPFITSIDADGTAHLSAPLPQNVPAGSRRLQDLKYQPFQSSAPANPLPCIAPIGETYQGWMKYVATVAAAARDALGTQGKPDSGFDIEVWNELSFGSSFLDINNYYNKSLGRGAGYSYSHTRSAAGLVPRAPTTFKTGGSQSILPMTVDFFSDSANGYRGVNVISGFSNQHPWESGHSLWSAQAGFSRHYYTGGLATQISPSAPFANSGKTRTSDALGGQSDFVPTFAESFPEYWESGLKTENLIRDLQPDSRTGHGESGPASGVAGALTNNHGRYTNNGDLRPPLLVETETNWFRQPFMHSLQTTTGVSAGDPQLESLDEWFEGKLLLRQYLFHASKGLDRTYVFNNGAGPLYFGMLPPALLTALGQSGGTLTPDVRVYTPVGLRALDWIHDLMTTGEPIVAPRPLSVTHLVEYKPRLVFAGDGSAAHPSLYNRDLFAFLPYQLSATHFAIPYYVATVDVTHIWDDTKGPLDHTRYDMPPQTFDVTIANIAGVHAQVSVFDPLTREDVPVTAVRSTSTTLTVRLEAVDYPRFLQITEAHPGPQILNPVAQAVGFGKIKVSFQTNVPVNPALSFGDDWTDRAAHTVKPTASSAQRFSQTFQSGSAAVPAVRISVTNAAGLYDVWPRWDEDPAGQVIMPSSGQ